MHDDAMTRVPIDLIRTDGSTQHRPVEDEVVDRYVALMKDGVDFPPVELTFDGADYWLWDGFHRCECARRLGREEIAAHVRPGSQRDALWLSFGANRDHGLPRPPGTAKTIIMAILADPSWSKTSLSAIARHVGVTQQYVSKIKDHWTEIVDRTSASGKCEAASHLPKATPVSEPRTAQGTTSCTPQRSDEIQVRTAGAVPYTQRSQEKRRASKPAGADGDGREIPEHLYFLFAEAAKFKRFAQAISTLKGQVKQAVAANPSAWSHFNENAFRAEMQKAHDLLSLSAPFIVCSYCGGRESEECRGCKGTGFLTKAEARCVPQEMRP